MFANPQPGADEVTFQVDNTSVAYYSSPYYKLHQLQLQPVPPPSSPQPRITLADVTGPTMVAAITAAKKITFHSVGDTGAAKVTASQSAAVSIAHEGSIADRMAADVGPGGPTAPAFFFHLGDIIYYFGESQYYYDQFYEPFRGYDRPIFAIPGNHDGCVFGPNPNVPQVPSLQAFLRNFCAPAPGPSPDSGGLVRSVMTQPGVYFTLDAPFVSIIGLYSNVLEGPGIISSQGGAYPSMTDEQLVFLQAELTRLKPAHDAGQQAVLIAVHHPPVSIDSLHSGAVGLSNDIDSACQAAGLWPDAVLSGHAHLYQRFSRSVPGLNRSIPLCRLRKRRFFRHGSADRRPSQGHDPRPVHPGHAVDGRLRLPDADSRHDEGGRNAHDQLPIGEPGQLPRLGRRDAPGKDRARPCRVGKENGKAARRARGSPPPLKPDGNRPAGTGLGLRAATFDVEGRRGGNPCRERPCEGQRLGNHRGERLPIAVTFENEVGS